MRATEIVSVLLELLSPGRLMRSGNNHIFMALDDPEYFERIFFDYVRTEDGVKR